MNLHVKPSSQLKGTIRLPASKSYSIRAFIIAACGGQSTIDQSSDCDDAKVAMRAAGALGAQIKKHKSGSRWCVTASKKRLKLKEIDVGESGTVLRFLLPLLALHGKKAKVIGQGTLRGRPNVFLTRTLRSMGVDIKGTGRKESIPIRLSQGRLHGGNMAIDGSLSSQFISALLIACPQLAEDTRLTLKGKTLVSLDYIAMTQQTLKKSGIKIVQKGPRQYHIQGNQKYKGLKNFTVPSDYGLASFLMAAALLAKSNVTLKGHLKDNLLQADGHILALLRKMGARFQKTSKQIQIKGPCALKGGHFSLKDCPDLVPIMTVLALFAKGKTRLYNISHVRTKESDRISDLRKELKKIGANITEKRDELIITPQAQYKTGRLLNPHKDHRLAMAFCVLGTKLGVRVKDSECTHKSYPNFVKDFKALGVSLRKFK